MNETNQYIKMCEKAEEIQEIFKNRNDELGYVRYVFGERSIWLPSQEQLQEMVKDEIGRLLRDFVLFARNYFHPPTMDKINVRFYSMSELWLAYVMKKKYKKYWDSEDWTIENVS